MQAIILAGGFGTRLRTRVSDVPKPMAPVAGQPFLVYLLDALQRQGCAQVVLATGHLSEVIERHIGHSHRGMPVQYSHEAAPLGTGGAIRQALRLLPPLPTLVLNGDTWLGLDLRDFEAWCDARAPADAVVLRRVPDVARFGSVTLDGEQVLRFGEKAGSGAGLINAGVYRLRAQTFDGFDLPAAFSIENDLFQPHAARLGLRGHVSEGHFIDIGVPEDYDRAQIVLPQWTAR